MGVYLSEPNKTKTTETGTSALINYAASSMQGWRTNMEDAHIADTNLGPDTQIYGVFDGHGGKEVALFAKRHFIEELKKNSNFKEARMELALKETFLMIDTLLLTPEGKKELSVLRNDSKELTNSDLQMESNAGCTANVALIYKKQLFVANAGDSRCLLAAKKEIISLSTDHKPDLDLEKQRIIKAGGFVVDGRMNSNLNLSRALGDLEYKKNPAIGVDQQLIIAVPDIVVYNLTEKTDFILLGCDGVWETLCNSDIVEYIYDCLKKKVELKLIVETLLDKLIATDTFSGVGCDNMTMVLAVFNNREN